MHNTIPIQSVILLPNIHILFKQDRLTYRLFEFITVLLNMNIIYIDFVPHAFGDTTHYLLNHWHRLC